jgi:hypothetical protein
MLIAFGNSVDLSVALRPVLDIRADNASSADATQGQIGYGRLGPQDRFRQLDHQHMPPLVIGCRITASPSQAAYR